MAVIGTFAPTKDGGWAGTIQTMTINVKARIVPNDNRDNDQAPAFRIFVGRSELGAAWRQRSNADPPRAYLSVKLDDPALPEGISAALFENEDGKEAQLVWSRRP
ncbi:MAG: DUF736 family protein [Alphaproteobacteria bacterium]|nr:DUF736 family protein [Alphaproteobacteria bacterium]MDE2074147.1 DUF736 domain-containing protein [Alphaproteobacteria bacterium]MDE2352843.1 DUF736 domain-containing protein [Alphaproteobacteria bacterium]